MEKIIIFIKNYLGELMIILGAWIFTYNVFNFSFQGGGEWIEGTLPRLPSFGGYEQKYVAYFYNSGTLHLIAIGAILIVGGILIIRNKIK